jgi:exopolysaccharide biosynthesis polyprenyl glycosylphosphotransferase
MLPSTRINQIWQRVIQLIVDFCCLNVGIGIVYLYRFKYFPELFDSAKRLTTSQYFEFNLVFSSTIIIILAVLGIYEVNQRRSIFGYFGNILLGIFIVIFALISFFFFFEFDKNVFPNGIPISRFVLFFAGFSSFFSILFGRFLIWIGQKILQLNGYGKSKVIVIGQHNQELVSYLQSQNNIDAIEIYTEINTDNLQKIEAKIKSRQVDEIYAIINQNSDLLARIAWLSERYKINFIFSPEGFGQFEFFDLQPKRIKQKIFLEIIHSNLNGWKIVIKRIFDIVFAFVFLTLLSPIYLLISTLIFLEDRQNPFYLSDRVGPDGKTFKLWKFRRLKVQFCTSEDNLQAIKIENDLIKERDVRGDGILYKIENDPRSTKIGRLIEKTSLDELPQFWNVLIGNMSVVGPRPHQPREVARYKGQHYKVLNIKPGITGMAQISGRSDLKFDQEVELDCWYIENWSFFLDLIIILKTPVALSRGHKG